MGRAMSLITSEIFLRMGNEIAGQATTKSSYSSLRRFRSFFGTSPDVCVILWHQLQTRIPEHGSPEHVLWALLFLKVYATEDVLCSFVRVDRKTFRKWCWIFVDAISHLPNVSYNINSHLTFTNELTLPDYMGK